MIMSKKNIIRVLILALALALIIIGLMDGGFRDVMAKAVRTCLECIGIG